MMHMHKKTSIGVACMYKEVCVLYVYNWLVRFYAMSILGTFYAEYVFCFIRSFWSMVVT